ncbi:uncharacterized protein Gasu_11060 [Galdieria sulphuraria]|uniref:Uncharacterized protein n=1 Tax=Galdieria sulphuraria TaxID=130081 RepID=M2X5G2_GALSU|nr:uncharacterized protein Gasu_11060 [Galdieria sulphuraria]EME31730.1 hypothetical protein Gasu_11060 [Galdieria sulphuraria]|eukprot:XP_005708250.1 hypothetical protein Gasu_11060 [Galdieria sulphuraria]
MKSRDSYERAKVEEGNHVEEFSVELEDVFFDSLSDHFEERGIDWPEYEENSSYSSFKTDVDCENGNKFKKRGKRKKKQKSEAQRTELSSTQTGGNQTNNSSFTGIIVERSKPRSVFKEKDGKKEMENRFFAELKLLKEHMLKKEQDFQVTLFSSCQVGKKKSRLISSALSTGTGFEFTASFDCSNNLLKNAGTRVGDDGATYLFKSLESQKVLSTLNLSSNDIGPVGAKALAEYLGKNSSVPESIDISHNHIGDNGAIDIANSLLSDFCKLQRLNICNNSIGVKGTEALILSLSEKSLSGPSKQFHLDLSYNYYSREVLDTVERLKRENGKCEIILSQDYLQQDTFCEDSLECNNHMQSSEADEEFDSTGEGWCNCESVQDIFNAANVIEAWLWNTEKSLFCPEKVNEAYDSIIRYLDEELNFSENSNFNVLPAEQSQDELNDIQYRKRNFDNKSEVCDLPPAVRATVELLDILMQPVFDDLFEGCSHKALTEGDECFRKCNEKDNELITPYAMCSQSRIVFPRLRYFRYKCIEIIWKLVCFRFQCIDNLLSYQGIMSRCLELISEYPQSNCFQNLLLKIFEEAFGSERNSDILLWSFLLPWSFASNTAYNVLHVIRDVYTLNSLLNEKFPKIGNLSALSTVSRFARLLKEKADQFEEIRMMLENNKEWHKLQEEIFPKLLDMASSYALGDEVCCLGGKKPVRSSFSSGPPIDWAAIFRGFPGNSFSRLSLGR